MKKDRKAAKAMNTDKQENPAPEEGAAPRPAADEDINDGATAAQIEGGASRTPASDAARDNGQAQQEGEASTDQWREALELAVKQRDEYRDSLLRSQADFQNFKRRNQTAHADGYEAGLREVIAAILPAIDNLERALDAAQKAEENGALVEGVRMTLNSLTEGLRRFGLEEIPALGEDFNPELHDAVMRESGDTPGKVLEVLQKGYRVHGKIIRHAMVKVCAEE